MKSFCILELGMSEDEAGKRIHAARKAHEYPVIFKALEDGRLHLTAVNLLGPHLTEHNSDALLAAAMDKSKSEIEQLIAERFPRTEDLPLVVALSPFAPMTEMSIAATTDTCGRKHAPEHVASPCKPTPIAPQRYALHVTMGQEMCDDLQRAQDLLAHEIPAADVAHVLHRGLKTLIRVLEKRKFGATDRPRAGKGKSSSVRRIPAAVRRAVAERDGRQCTFVATNGHRCPARGMLEFDHTVPVARGGQSTVENLRLRCRAHNQYEAEQVYGRGFMEEKKEEAVRAAAAKEQIEDVVSGLRSLGYPAARARRAAEGSTVEPDATIEQHLRAALRWLVPKRMSPGSSAVEPCSTGV